MYKAILYVANSHVSYQQCVAWLICYHVQRADRVPVTKNLLSATKPMYYHSQTKQNWKAKRNETAKSRGFILFHQQLCLVSIFLSRGGNPSCLWIGLIPSTLSSIGLEVLQSEQNLWFNIAMCKRLKTGRCPALWALYAEAQARRLK